MGSRIKEESWAKSHWIGREKEIIWTEIKVYDIGFLSELPSKAPQKFIVECPEKTNDAQVATE